MKIAFLGLGNMGTPMARNLLRAGHDVTVWNRTLSKAAELRADNGKAANSVTEATRGAEITISMLADDQAVSSVVRDAGGVLESLQYGTIHVSMSTISVAPSARLARDRTKAGQRPCRALMLGAGCNLPAKL